MLQTRILTVEVDEYLHRRILEEANVKGMAINDYLNELLYMVLEVVAPLKSPHATKTHSEPK